MRFMNNDKGPSPLAARSRWVLGLSALACLAASGCASAPGHLAPLTATPPGPYLLAAGDELRIAVFGVTAINNSYTVDDSGMIALPLLEPITISGMSVREAEAAIADRLRTRNIVLDPKVSAQIQTYRPFYISGEVQRPGQYPCAPGMSLARAVAIAGGFTFRADSKHATVSRVAAKGLAVPETPILPGDVVVVPEAWF